MTYISLKPSNFLSNPIFSSIKEKISVPLTDLQQRIFVVVSLALAFLAAITYYVTKRRNITKIGSADKNANENAVENAVENPHQIQITKVILANGTVLEGTAIPKTIEGNAKIFYANGDYKKGFFNRTGELEGPGESSSAQVRIGVFVNGEIKRGFIIHSGMIKDGDLDEIGCLQGRGKFIFKDKLEFGKFRKDYLVEGTIIYFGAEDKPNISLEVGTFSEGKLDGEGIRIYRNQRFEKGKFIKGKFQGESQPIDNGRIDKFIRVDSNGNITDGEYDEKGVLTHGKRYIFKGDRIGYENGAFKNSCLIEGDIFLFDQRSDIRYECGNYSEDETARLLQGKGARLFKNGIFQKGDFDQGVFTKAEPSFVEGKDGITFEGEIFAHDKESNDDFILGWGTKRYPDGSYLRGRFDDDVFGEFIEGEIFSAIHNYQIIGKFETVTEENLVPKPRKMIGKFINLQDNFGAAVQSEEGTFEINMDKLFKLNCHSLEGQGKRTYKDGRIEEGTFIGGVFQNQPKQ